MQNFDGGVKETSCTYSEPLCVNEERTRFPSVSETNVVKTFGVSRTLVIRTAWEERRLRAGRLRDLSLYKPYSGRLLRGAEIVTCYQESKAKSKE